MSLRQRLIEALVHPRVGNAAAVVFRDRLPHGRVRVNTADPAFTPRVKAAILWNLYERNEIRMTRRHMIGGVDLVDLGASLGVTSLHALELIPPDGQLVAVEANPALEQALRSNLTDRRCSVISGAVSYRSGPTRMRIGTSTLVSRLDDNGVLVPSVRLRDVLSMHHIGDYTLLCDIEGAERQILDEDAESLARCREMVIELHGDIDGLVRAIGALGFRQLGRGRNTFAFAR